MVSASAEPYLIGNSAYSAPRYGWNSNGGAGVPAFGSGDVIQFAIDADARTIWVRKNGAGAWNLDATADPATGTGGVDISGIGVGPLYAFAAVYAQPGQVTSRFAAAQLGFAPPAGFSAVA